MRAAICFLCSCLLITPLYSQSTNRPDALASYRSGDYSSAIAICKEELQENPSNMDSWSVMLWSLLKQGQWAEAIVQAQKAREYNRYDPRIVEGLAEALFYQGKNKDALKLFEDYVTLAPEGARIDLVYYFMGEIYIRLGKFRHADIALSTAVRYSPSSALWWIRLGYAREQAGDTRFALEAYDKALSLDPQSSDARRGSARLRG